MWQELHQLQLFLCLGRVKLESEPTLAAGSQVIEMALHRLVNVTAGRDLSTEQRPTPRHRLVDVGVHGFGHL
jgi:hypothetical protein